MFDSTAPGSSSEAASDDMFAVAAERFLASRAAIGLKTGTLEDYEGKLRLHVLPTFGSKRLWEISVEDVEAFAAAERAAGAAVNSIRDYVTLVSAVFTYEIRRGRCESNPVSRADLPRRGDRQEVRYLTREELETLLAAVPADELGRLERVLYLTAAMTGLRRGELLALRRLDVDLEAGLLRVRRSFRRGRFDSPKTRSSVRAVPLGQRVRAELAKHLESSKFVEPDDLVFGHPRTGNPYDPSNMRIRFQAARERAGLRPMRFHDLRHTYGTQMAAAGAPLRSIQAWLGHSDYQTTAIYADYAPDFSQAAAFAARAFGEIDPDTTPPLPLPAHSCLLVATSKGATDSHDDTRAARRRPRTQAARARNGRRRRSDASLPRRVAELGTPGPSLGQGSMARPAISPSTWSPGLLFRVRWADSGLWLERASGVEWIEDPSLLDYFVGRENGAKQINAPFGSV